MPTGYTDIIEKGATFEQYVWRCARAFGANVLMRDDPMDKPIEEYKVSNYHANAIEQAKTLLAELKAMTPEVAEERARIEYIRRLAEHTASLTRTQEIGARYASILQEVKAWNPPTDEHRGLKKFMLEQIEACRSDWDVSRFDEFKPKLLSGRDWLEQRIDHATRDVAYHTDEHAKEQQRAAERNEWNRALATSVPMPEKLEP